MNTSNILNLLLALALVLLSVKIVRTPQTTPAEVTTVVSSEGMGALENIMTRTSVRSYTDQPVSEEQVEIMLKAAMAAPTAGNKQPWEFIVINDKELLAALVEYLPYGKMVATAPVSIVACGELTRVFPGEGESYWIQDLSAATENLLLAAHAIGLGAVWVGIHPISDRVKNVQRILNLPSHIVPLSIIPIGYPNEHPTPKNKWREERVHYNGW